MTEKRASNWPSSRPAVQPSYDESLTPSRLTRTQINPKIPNELHDELMNFLGNNRSYKLQDVISRGIRLVLDEIAASRGRPAVQPSSRPAAIDQIDQIPDRDDSKEDGIDLDRRISDRPAVQRVDLTRELIRALGATLPDRIIETWFAALTIVADYEGPQIVVFAPNNLVRDWIVTKHLDDVDRAMREHDTLATFAAWPLAWKIGKESETAATGQPETEATLTLTASQCKRELLDFYALIMENAVELRDEAAFERIADCSPESVRAGIMRSRLKAREPVGSFAYCVKAIRQIENAGLGRELDRALRVEVFNQPLLPQIGADVVQLNTQRKDRK